MKTSSVKYVIILYFFHRFNNNQHQTRVIAGGRGPFVSGPFLLQEMIMELAQVEAKSFCRKRRCLLDPFQEKSFLQCRGPAAWLLLTMESASGLRDCSTSCTHPISPCPSLLPPQNSLCGSLYASPWSCARTFLISTLKSSCFVPL